MARSFKSQSSAKANRGVWNSLAGAPKVTLHALHASRSNRTVMEGQWRALYLTVVRLGFQCHPTQIVSPRKLLDFVNNVLTSVNSVEATAAADRIEDMQAKLEALRDPLQTADGYGLAQR